jgi:membrane-bound metal-dependent hydrolase YbcI (DUF457 family)
MPFTPIHLGFAFFIYSIFVFLDPIALILGTILIDLEPLVHLIFNVGKLHGKFHSFLGVIVLTVPISVISWGCFKIFKLNRFFKDFNWVFSLISSFLALVSHIFFDTIIYPEMMLFYPFSTKTGFLFGLWSQRTDYLILVAMFCVGAAILILRFILKKYYGKSELENGRVEEEK